MTARRHQPANTYPLYLIPGAVAFLAVIVYPFALNVYYSFTNWQGWARRAGRGWPTTGS